MKKEHWIEYWHYLSKQFIFLFLVITNRKNVIKNYEYASKNMHYLIFGSLGLFIISLILYLFVGTYLAMQESSYANIFVFIFLFSAIYLLNVVFFAMFYNHAYNQYKFEEMKRETQRRIEEEAKRRQREREEFKKSMDDLRKRMREARERAEEMKRQAEENAYRSSSYTYQPIYEFDRLLRILELPSNVRDLSVIKKQFRTLMKKYHPDVATGNEEIAKNLIAAYNRLQQLLSL